MAGALGRKLFLERCSVCHAVRGTPAKGTLGPDLTHVASRTIVAAGILPNDPREHRAAGSRSSQQIKPGNLMPSMNVFSERRAARARGVPREPAVKCPR